MSLADASDARKARLIALRKRKAGEVLDGDKSVVATYCCTGFLTANAVSLLVNRPSRS